jgi:hypothetical protein
MAIFFFQKNHIKKPFFWLKKLFQQWASSKSWRQAARQPIRALYFSVLRVLILKPSRQEYANHLRIEIAIKR